MGGCRYRLTIGRCVQPKPYGCEYQIIKNGEKWCNAHILENENKE